jgi:hypothetical protein
MTTKKAKEPSINASSICHVTSDEKTKVHDITKVSNQREICEN